jgi:hypothetical protein
MDMTPRTYPAALLTLSFIPLFALASPGDGTRRSIPAASTPIKSVFDTGGKKESPFDHSGSNEVPTKTEVFNPETVQFTALMSGTPAIVVVDGKDYEQGAIIMIGTNAAKFIAIKDENLVLRVQGKDYSIPLHRNKVLRPSTDVQDTKTQPATR